MRISDSARSTLSGSVRFVASAAAQSTTRSTREARSLPGLGASRRNAATPVASGTIFVLVVCADTHISAEHAGGADDEHCGHVVEYSRRSAYRRDRPSRSQLCRGDPGLQRGGRDCGVRRRRRRGTRGSCRTGKTPISWSRTAAGMHLGAVRRRSCRKQLLRRRGPARREPGLRRGASNGVAELGLDYVVFMDSDLRNDPRRVRRAYGRRCRCDQGVSL